MDYTRNTMRAAIKALDEVVTPAVDSTGQGQAIEQVRLVTDFLKLVEQRIHLIADRERFQLHESIELARQLDGHVNGSRAQQVLQLHEEMPKLHRPMPGLTAQLCAR